jgi:Flp pilus assembly protein CpaB
MNARAAKVRLARHRRPLAAAFAATAMGLGLVALRPSSPPGVQVLAAARDLPGGTTLRGGDVGVVALPAAAVPDGVVRRDTDSRVLTGRILAGPVRRGEPLTDARLVGTGLLDGYSPGIVATPVRIADAGAVRLLRAGDRVDVLAAAGGPVDDVLPVPAGRARTVVSSVPVIAVPRERAADQGALVVLATSREQSAALAGAGPRLSVTIVAGPAG